MQDVDPAKWAEIQKKFNKAKNRRSRPIREGEVLSDMRPEHQYGHGSMEQWELSVFENADHFTVIRNPGSSKHYRAEHLTFSEALTDAQKDQVSMLYAITAVGRSVMLPRKDWDRLLHVWEAHHGDHGQR